MGRTASNPLSHAVCGCGTAVDGLRRSHRPHALLELGLHNHPVCLILAVRSWTRLYTVLSSEIRRVIFVVAWITVVWSRPPNSFPIFGSEASVSSRERYIATWRG